MSVDLGRQFLDKEIRQGHTVVQCLFEGSGAILPDKRVGVLALGQEYEANLASFPYLGQGGLECSPCGGSAGPVPVEAKEYFFGEAKQAIQMIVGRSRAKCRHAEINAVPREPCNVHITFDDHELVDIPHRLAGLVQAVKFTTLVKQHRFRRVQILGFLVTQDPPAESDATTAGIADWKHDALTESVVMAAVILAYDKSHRQQALDQLLRFAELVEHRTPARGGKADAEAPCGCAVDSAAFEIVLRPLVVFQLVLIETIDFRQQLEKFVVSSGRPLAFLARYFDSH
jgi:hypothetical protein